MRFRQLLMVSASSVLLAGCASTSNYNTMLASWKGTKATQLTHVWGYPNSNAVAPNGNKLYIYSHHDISGGTGFGASSGNVFTYSGGVTDYSCTTWFEVNKQNVIVNTSYRGNNCSVSKQGMKKLENPYNPILAPIN